MPHRAGSWLTEAAPFLLFTLALTFALVACGVPFLAALVIAAVVVALATRALRARRRAGRRRRRGKDSWLDGYGGDDIDLPRLPPRRVAPFVGQGGEFGGGGASGSWEGGGPDLADGSEGTDLADGGEGDDLADLWDD
jgi:uncharacterized membrane protein YgcG